ncbi:MAG: 2,3-bisphosphoglycerate-independent phosphoglycerate mutase [Parcubacteria group bacterium Gr01-1014_3]|nr:MAG: 2,3-bisphosphoglycerate-independent phosphoglycerate mutase [Parcubacteria group bacterium Gr01-1014_3]
MKPTTVLTILDGFGVSYQETGNAIHQAKKPNLLEISRFYPGTALQASGIAVGIPWGDVGSSEVGHTNIGAGLVIYQNYPRISLAIQDGSFSNLPVWSEAIQRPRIHLMGLLSTGGIHAHVNHLVGLLEMLAKKKYAGEVYLHLFTDGEDSPPRTALTLLEQVETAMTRLNIGKIATLIGRVTALDRTKKLDLTEKTMAAIIRGEGVKAASAREAVELAYQNKIEDENLPPTVVTDTAGQPVGKFDEADALIFFNFRPDRARQLTEAFMKIKKLLLITMVSYQEDFKIPVAFAPQNITEPLAKAISDAGKNQAHIAETEKYAHITYFLNGGAEKPFPKEDRVLVPSKDNFRYDKKPEMSAREITEKAIAAIGEYDFIAINLANSDMVAHTGNLDAGIQAIEIVDECLGKIKARVAEVGGTLVITGDHGNAEEMINLETGQIDTGHSTNPVPLWIVNEKYRQDGGELVKDKVPTAGILADVAPTILEILAIQKPKEMTGRSLLGKIGKLPI